MSKRESGPKQGDLSSGFDREERSPVIDLLALHNDSTLEQLSDLSLNQLLSLYFEEFKRDLSEADRSILINMEKYMSSLFGQYLDSFNKRYREYIDQGILSQPSEADLIAIMNSIFIKIVEVSGNINTGASQFSAISSGIIEASAVLAGRFSAQNNRILSYEARITQLIDLLANYQKALRFNDGEIKDLRKKDTLNERAELQAKLNAISAEKDTISRAYEALKKENSLLRDGVSANRDDGFTGSRKPGKNSLKPAVNIPIPAPLNSPALRSSTKADIPSVCSQKTEYPIVNLDSLSAEVAKTMEVLDDLLVLALRFIGNEDVKDDIIRYFKASVDHHIAMKNQNKVEGEKQISFEMLQSNKGKDYVLVFKNTSFEALFDLAFLMKVNFNSNSERSSKIKEAIEKKLGRHGIKFDMNIALEAILGKSIPSGLALGGFDTKHLTSDHVSTITKLMLLSLGSSLEWQEKMTNNNLQIGSASAMYTAADFGALLSDKHSMYYHLGKVLKKGELSTGDEKKFLAPPGEDIKQETRGLLERTLPTLAKLIGKKDTDDDDKK